ELELDGRGTALVAATVAGFYPVLEALQQAQVSAFLALAAFSLVVAVRERRPWAAALCLLVLSIKPQTLPPALVVLALRREGRVLGAAAVLGAVAFTATTAVLGASVWSHYLGGLASLERLFGVGTPDHMPTVRGFLTRLLGPYPR